MALPAFLVPLLGGIARAGASIFARKGATSVAGAAARAGVSSTAAKGAAGTVGRVSAGQTVLDGESWRNARMMTKALELAKKGGGTVRQAMGAGAGSASLGGRPRASATDYKGQFDEYVKGLQKGSISKRYQRLTEAGQMLSTSKVQAAAGTLHPSEKQMVQHSERALIRAKQKELRRQDRETKAKSLNHMRLARATGLLIQGSVGFYALGRAMGYFAERVRMSSDRLGQYSMLIAGEKRLTELARMIADIRTARMTERTYGALSKSGRQAIEAWQRPKATATNIKNTIGMVTNKISAMFGTFFTSILEMGDRITELIDGIKEDQRENELPQQAFRDYWNAMSQGKWDTDLGADRPRKPKNPRVDGPDFNDLMIR